ncbi:NAD-dependent epimerase/dehydratase family protein [Nocardioides campestrisoli]|uniref:NAD-dependent epimerase/dehydratase family protein n=1 Tax=Nocardioides campestrisoli TaxID=2736757 RepID=UPI0015E7A6B5|nr:NAD-dependent epimerase/dehydratase family protein [Nocardioides campestrisoli]
MRIVVVGATGNIGTAVVEQLAAEPQVRQVVGVARRLPATRDAATPGGVPVTWHGADVRTDSLEPIFDGADAVVHLAWMFQPTHDPETTWATNAIGTSRVLEAATRAGVSQVVAASSIAAYSPRVDDSPVEESYPTDGASASSYAREKAYVERLLDTHEARGDLVVTRLRPAFVFQRRASSEQVRIFGGSWVPQRLVRPGLVPVLPFPRDVFFQTVHAADLADAVVRTLLQRAGGPFNLCAPGVVEPADLAALLDARHVPVPKLLVRGAIAAGWHSHLVGADPRLWDALTRLPVMSDERARTELGWAPAHTATEALAEMLTGVRERAGHGTAPLHPA